jgi:O-antigen/teichoic acid export membrane protein
VSDLGDPGEVTGVDDTPAVAAATPSQAARLLQLARHSLVYGLGSVASKVAAVILLPLYTAYLRPADFGRVELVMSAVAAGAIVTQLGLVNSFFRFWFDDEADAARRRTFRVTLVTLLCTGTAGALVVVAVAEPIGRALLGTTTSAGTHLVRIGALGIWVQTIYQLFAALFRVQQRPVAFSVATLVNLLVTVALTVTLVVGMHLHATGLLLGNFLGSIVVLCGLVVVQRRWVFGRTAGEGTSRTLLRRLLDFGLPMVPAAAAIWAVTLMNRPVLSAMAGAAAVGLFAIGFKLAQSGMQLVQAFQLSWPAFAHSIKDDQDARRTYASVLSAYAITMGTAVLAIGLLAPWLVRWLTQPAYYGAVPTVLPLTAGAALYGGFFIASIGTARAKKTRSNWIVTMVAAGVELGLLLLLVPRYDVVGAAWSVFVAYLVMFALMLRQSHRHFPGRWQWRRLGGAVGSVALLAGVGTLAVPEQGVGALAIRIALLALVVPLMVLLGAVRPGEVRAVRRRLTPKRRASAAR